MFVIHILITPLNCIANCGGKKIENLEFILLFIQLSHILCKPELSQHSSPLES